MFSNFSELPTFGPKQFEAFTTSSASAASDVQAIYSEATNYISKSFENGLKHMEKLAGATKPEEAFKLQSEFVRTACEDFVTESTKIGNLYLKAVTAAFPAFGEKSAPTSTGASSSKKAAASLND
jgi:hypothetical protein